MMPRGSRRRCCIKKGLLKNFSKFTEKHLCQSLFFNKDAGAADNFIKKETLAQVFSCEFCKIFKNTFFIEHLRWLLLDAHLMTIQIRSCIFWVSIIFAGRAVVDQFLAPRINKCQNRYCSL